MVNPGTFRGSRREFLIQQIEGYIQAVEEGRAAEFIADVVRRYLKRYPLTLTHNIEPSPEHLATVNDNAPDPEIQMPDEDNLTFEEYEKEMIRYQEDRRMLKYRAEQIRRWLRYQYSKRRDMSAKETGLDNPWTILLYRLTGVGLVKPRKPQAFALWYKANAADVDAAWQTNVDDLQKKKKPILPSQRAAAFQSFKSKTYRLLPEAEKSAWQDLATEEHEAATKEFEEKLQAPVSKEPNDLQQHLERLPSVVKPLMEMIGEATGCIVSVYVAGPQPADSGRLHIASFHGGKTLGSVKQNFVEAERANFKRFVLPIYSTFLKKCYTVETCRERALPVDTPTLESIGFAAEEEGVALHPVVGEIFNASGGSETITTTAPTTKSVGKSKKPLRVPPVKKTNDASKTATAGTAPAPEAGTVPVPERVPEPEPEGEVEGVTPLAPEQPATPPSPPPPAIHQREDSLPPTSSSLPRKTPPPASQGLPVRSPPASPAPSRAESATRSIPPSPVISRASSVARSDIPTVQGQKRGVEEETVGEEEEGNGDSSRARKKRRQGLDDGDAGTERIQRKKQTKDAKGQSQQSAKKSQASKGSQGPSSSKKSNTIVPSAMNEAPNLTLPSNAPKWAFSAVKLFQREKVSVEFLRLVEKWIAFEVRENHWDDGGKLSAVDRPKPVADWINRARTERFQLQAVKSGADPVKELETKFWLWWSQLQPDFRMRDESNTMLFIDEDGHADRKSEGNWEGLRRPGLNGWVSIMAALCFWEWNLKGMTAVGHRGVAAAKHAREEWLRAVDDVNFVLGQF